VDVDREERSRDCDRFLTFVDAVVAIAITLLVLPLVDVAGQLDGGSVAHLLSSHSTQVWGFLLSFAVIAALWLAQHQTVHSLVALDGPVVRLMLGWMLTIVFLPFPTALVAEAGEQPIAKLLYIGTMAVSSTLLALLAVAIGRTRALRDTDAKPDPAPAVGSALGFLVALAVSLAVPATGYYPLLVLLLPGPVLALWRRRARGGREPRGAVGE
jgi:uncharacterized membrane protein